jgi:hypothetical protein
VIFAVAVVATSSSSRALRAVSIAALMPLFSVTLLDDLLAYGGHHFDGMRYLHHLAVALGVAAYVVGAPQLQRWARHRVAAVAT